MSDLKNRVLRLFAVAGGSAAGHAELASWAGIPLLLHKIDDHNGHIKMAEPFACSHEPTGYRIATGPSPETALASAVAKLRRNWDEFPALIAKLPVLNGPCHHEELDMDGVCKSCGLGGAPSRW